MDIKEALAQLDTFEDDHWTSDGAPKLDKVSELVGSKVSRQAVIDAAPKFSRENPVVEDDEPKQETEEEPEQEVRADSGMIDDFLQKEMPTPEDFLRFLKEVPKEELPRLRDTLEVIQSKILRKQKDIDELVRRVRFALGHTKARVRAEVPDVSNGQAIQGYIKSQQEQRAAKYSATQEIFKSVDLKTLDPRAPIDRAMARKTQRGGQRPVHPKK